MNNPITNPTGSRNTAAFSAQAAISFGIALLGVVWAVLYLPMDPWQRAFVGMTTLFLVSSSFTLAKVVRDNQEHNDAAARLEQELLERLIERQDAHRAA